MKNEPLVTLASITAGATALIGLLVAFGVPLSAEQQVAILAVVAVAAPFVVAVAGRAKVTPNGSVVELALPMNTPGKRLVVAGEANEIETGKTIRVLEDSAPAPEEDGSNLAHFVVNGRDAWVTQADVIANGGVEATLAKLLRGEDLDQPEGDAL